MYFTTMINRNICTIAIICTRSYCRWLNRTPVRIKYPYEAAKLNEEEIIELDQKVLKDTNFNESFKALRSKIPDALDENGKGCVKNKKKLKVKSNLTDQNLSNFLSEKKICTPVKLMPAAKKENNVFDKNGELIYVKLKDNDSIVSSVLTRIKSKKNRVNSGQVLLETWRLIAEGLTAGYKLDALFFSRYDDLLKLRPFLPSTGPKLYKMPYKEIQMWSHLDTSPGIMGVFEVPNLTKLAKRDNVATLPLNIVCDNIRDPGNLGSILRIAAAVGSQKLLLTKGCVDLWDSKVLRSASGAHFQLDIQTNFNWADIHKTNGENTLFCIADNKYTMPIIKTNSKLNSELSFDARRNARDLLSETNQGQSKSSENVENLEEIRIPLIPYYDINFTTTENVTLVVGGETHGLSEECYIYANMLKGVRLNIPMNKGMESLNAGAALAILAFEIRKQFLCKATAKSVDTSPMY